MYTDQTQIIYNDPACAYHGHLWVDLFFVPLLFFLPLSERPVDSLISSLVWEARDFSRIDDFFGIIVGVVFRPFAVNCSLYNSISSWFSSFTLISSFKAFAGLIYAP